MTPPQGRIPNHSGNIVPRVLTKSGGIGSDIFPLYD
jgi:hypothetical protein